RYLDVDLTRSTVVRERELSPRHSKHDRLECSKPAFVTEPGTDNLSPVERDMRRIWSIGQSQTAALAEVGQYVNEFGQALALDTATQLDGRGTILNGLHLRFRRGCPDGQLIAAGTRRQEP